jgi:CheY-like chemotaxis protein/HPt (histidine-containing phosphotransfer) domain-containing protein
MSSVKPNIEAFQALLAKMRDEFIVELAERCDKLDDLIMQLERSPESRHAFDELYRAVHSLKGSGGTHGLSIITTLCHQLENHLTEADAKREFTAAFASKALAYVDLLRRIEGISRQPTPDYSPIESEIEALRQSGLQSRKIGLIAETSPMMVAYYRQALHALPLQLTSVDSGLAALERLLHEHYDFLIVGRELKDLNGIAMVAALRSSQLNNQDIPAILVSSKLGAVPEHAGFSDTILRDQNLASHLVMAVKGMLGG